MAGAIDLNPSTKQSVYSFIVIIFRGKYIIPQVIIAINAPQQRLIPDSQAPKASKIVCVPLNNPPVYNIKIIDVMINTITGINKSNARPFSDGFSFDKTSPSVSRASDISLPLFALLSIAFILPKSKPVIANNINIVIVNIAYRLYGIVCKNILKPL